MFYCFVTASVLNISPNKLLQAFSETVPDETELMSMKLFALTTKVDATSDALSVSGETANCGNSGIKLVKQVYNVVDPSKLLKRHSLSNL